MHQTQDARFSLPKTPGPVRPCEPEGRETAGASYAVTPFVDPIVARKQAPPPGKQLASRSAARRQVPPPELVHKLFTRALYEGRCCLPSQRATCGPERRAKTSAASHYVTSELERREWSGATCRAGAPTSAASWYANSKPKRQQAPPPSTPLDRLQESWHEPGQVPVTDIMALGDSGAARSGSQPTGRLEYWVTTSGGANSDQNTQGCYRVAL